MLDLVESIEEMFAAMVIPVTNGDDTQTYELKKIAAKSRNPISRQRDMKRAEARCRAFFDWLARGGETKRSGRRRQRRLTGGTSGRTPYVYVGERLETIKKMLSQKMTQGQIARALGINQGTVSKIARKIHV